MTFPQSFSLSLAFHKLTLIYASIFPFVSTNSTKLSILKLACIYVPIYQLLETIAMFEILFDFSLVVKAIFGQNDRFSSFLSHFEITYILRILLVNVSTESMGFPVRPVAIIGHEIVRIVCLCGKYLDGSLAMSHSIFKITQVDVFVGNILKAKAIFLAFSWQIYLPVSKIKSTTIVPNDIFTRIQLKVQTVLELSSYDLLLLSIWFYPKQLEYFRTQFLVIFKALACLRWVQRKTFRYLQLLHYFLPEVIFHFCNFPLRHKLFLENDAAIRLQLYFLWILVIFSPCFCLEIMQLNQLVSLALNLIYHSFTYIFLLDSIAGQSFRSSRLFSFALTGHG